MGVVEGGASPLAGRRRHIPPSIFILGVILLAVASARPQLTFPLPRLEGTIVLAMDVSSSMAAADVEPTRMEAAKMMAKGLSDRRPDSTSMAVVAFGEGGLVVQTPTDDNEALNATIDRLEPQSGTSLGQGLLTALNLVAAGAGPAADPTAGDSVSADEREPSESFAPAIIVMLTDGENTDPPEPSDVAQLAIERGVRVHTVGVGTEEGAIIEVDGFNLFTRLNAPVLQEIAILTEGTYFNLDEVADLASVYEELDTEFVVESQEVEVTFALAGISAVLFLLGGALSLFWFGRMP